MREWQTVTVAFAFSSRPASGRPTRIERPTITASAPSTSIPRPASSSITPAACRGRGPGGPGRAGRRWSAVRPSTSLAGVDRGDDRVLVDRVRAAGAGPGSRRPRRRRSARATSASRSSCEVSAPELVVDRAHARLLARLALVAHVDLRRRGRRRRARSPGPAGGRARRRAPRPRPRPARAPRAATRLAVDDRALSSTLRPS